MIRSETPTYGGDFEVFLAKQTTKHPLAGRPTEEEKKKTEVYMRNAGLKSNAWNIDDIVWFNGVPQTKSRVMKIKSIRSALAKPADIIPCVGVFPGTKEEPYRPNGWPEGFYIQEDNVALEFNIPVAESFEKFNSNIMVGKKLVEELCDQKKLIPMWNVPTHMFKPKDLQSPQAKTFGCEPDNCAYDGGAERPSNFALGRYRTAGGHIHVGGRFNCPDWVGVLFLEAALFFRFGADGLYKDPTRINTYGAPGSFRNTDYGFEYRSLPVSFLQNDGFVETVTVCTASVAEGLVSTPADQLQRAFRMFPWAQLRQHLVEISVPAKTKKESQERSKAYQSLRHRFTKLNLKGISQ